MAVFLALVAALATAGSAHDSFRYRVPSESMEPTYDVGDRVTVDRTAYRHHAPRLGDVVVFYPPKGAEAAVDEACGAPQPAGAMCAEGKPGIAHARFIKRVVGLPGDRLALRDGHVVRDGRTLREPYIATCPVVEGCDFPTPIRVPAGEYYMLGDNRGGSADSRFFGPARRGRILGRVQR